MSLKTIIPWLVIGVVCIALVRVGVNLYGGIKDDLNKFKGKVKKKKVKKDGLD